jgi:hypothetical protein
MGKKGTDRKDMWGKSEGRKPPGRTRRRCEENVNLEFRDIGRMWSELIWLRTDNWLVVMTSCLAA